jgi:hypothetical protein
VRISTIDNTLTNRTPHNVCKVGGLTELSGDFTWLARAILPPWPPLVRSSSFCPTSVDHFLRCGCVRHRGRAALGIAPPQSAVRW